MMKALITALTVLVGALMVGVGVYADEEHIAPAEDLSPKLRTFLQKEMVALAYAGREIEAALAQGDSQAVQDLASQMHETFIFQDEITTFDLRELKATLGDDFVAQDKAFHALARKLEKTKNPMQQKALFASMLHVCAACHKSYAPEAPLLEE